MAFFQFGKKIEIAREYSLEEIPVFSSLTPSEQKLIQRQARLIEYKRGDIVYEEGTASEFFYVVISGRYRLFRSHNGKKDETLHYFYRGDHFGETSLLNNQPHSASVEAKRDGLILKLPKDDFLKIVKDIPSVSLHISRSLGHRLTRNSDAAGKREVKLAAFYSATTDSRANQLWIDMTAAIVKEAKGEVVLVDFVDNADSLAIQEFGDNMPVFNLKTMDPSDEHDFSRSILHHQNGFNYLKVSLQDVGSHGDKKISTLITFLTYRFNYCLLRLPMDLTDVSFKALKKSDYVYVFSGFDGASITTASAALLEFQQSFGFSKTEIKLIFPDDRDLFQNIAVQEKMMGVPVLSILPSKIHRLEQYESVVRYISRELVGTLLGLVLGSGAAYGLAHIGVLKVLEEQGIHPDIIAGTSIGALVGALWAAGYSARELEDIAKSLNKSSAFFKLVGFGDLSFFDQGFLKGNKVRKFLEGYLGDKTFQDLKIPLRVVAADLFTSEEVILDQGSVLEAVRASISIPGIFKPVVYNDRYLIDGGVIDPLPVRVLAMHGVKKIISVNVLAGPKDRIDRNFIRKQMEADRESDLDKESPIKRVVSASLHKVSSRYAVNIFNVIMSTVQFMEFEIANTWGSQADVLIHPIVPEGHWAEFYSPDKYIAMGEKKTREQLGEIKRLMSE